MNDWKNWLHGLAAAAIGGAATVAAGFAAGADWSVLGKMVLYRAVVDVALYLKQSPLPSSKVQVIATTTETVETKGDAK